MNAGVRKTRLFIALVKLDIGKIDDQLRFVNDGIDKSTINCVFRG